MNELFYSKDNMERIEKSVQQIREGKVVRKTIEELEVMENIYILILRHKKLGGIQLENIKEQFFVFENRETVETWLLNNGFLFGHCDGFANVPGEFYWFHQKDTPMDMVEIEIQTHKLIDQDTISEEWIEKLMYRGREVRRKGNSDGYNE